MSRGGRPVATTPDDWARAALELIETAGVGGLSVEGAARRLGVSKGGAYHHFRDRRALLRAALDRWERLQVTEFNARHAALEDPRHRLHAVLVEAFVAITPSLIVQLLAAADDPDVAPVLERSSTARIELLRRTFRDLGASRADAEHRAIRAYSHYLGYAELRRHSPALLATPARRRAHLERLEESLLAGLGA